MKKNHLLLLSFFLFSMLQIKAINHPCLIVTKDMYPALRASDKNKSPLLASTIGSANAKWSQAVLPFTTPNMDYWAYWYTVPLSANALMYIQYYDNETLKAAYRTATIDVIKRFKDQYPILGNTDHANTVYAAGAFVSAIVAMDIMHDDFTPTELALCDSIIDDFSVFFINHVSLSGTYKGRTLGWDLAWKGANAVYYLYKDNKAMIPIAVEEYKNQLVNYDLNSDGSWINTPGYWHARLSGDRVAKWCCIDILSFMGYYDFYKDRKLIKTMDWCNAFTLTPWGAFLRLGETNACGTSNLSSDGLMYRMSRWSEKAGANAAWFLQNKSVYTTTSLLFAYLLTPSTLPAPIMPTSSLFKYSGASFWDNSNATESLQGVLYCPQRELPLSVHETLGHASSDVNSVSINGYGEYLIMNAGTNYYPSYPGKRPDGGRWTDAWMQNVVLVDGKSMYLDLAGNGLTDLYSLKDADGVKMGHGLVGGMIEFAESDISVSTTGNANHWRTLFSIKPIVGESNGYFLLRDKVQSSKPNKVVTVLLHPNSMTGSVSAISDKTEYQGVINGFITPNSDQSEKINIFYATTPDSVNIKQAWKASAGSSQNASSTNLFMQHNFLSDYLRSCYKTGTNGYAKIATVLFPQDNLHAKAGFSSISDPNYSGAQITHHANCIDYFLVPNAAVDNLYNGFTFNGESVFFRKSNRLLSNYAVANGVKLKDGALISTGFSSDNNISIEMDDKIGSVMTDGARVTFSYPGIRGVKLNNTSLTIVSSTLNSVVVDIPAGKYALELVNSLPTSVLPTTISSPEGDPNFLVSYMERTKSLNISNSCPIQNNASIELVLSNLIGKRVLTKRISLAEESSSIDLSTLPSGLYLWSLKNEGQSLSGKVKVK